MHYFKIAAVSTVLGALMLASPMLGSAAEPTFDELVAEFQRLDAAGKKAESVQVMERILKSMEADVSPEDPSLSLALYNLSFLYRDLGQYTMAKPHVDRLLAIDGAALGPNDQNWATDLEVACDVERGLKNLERAREHCSEALKIRLLRGDRHPDVAIAALKLGLVEDMAMNGAEALKKYKQAVNVRLFRLERGKRTTLTEPLFIEAIRIRESTYGSTSTAVADALDIVAEFYAVLEKADKESAARDRAANIRNQ